MFEWIKVMHLLKGTKFQLKILLMWGMSHSTSYVCTNTPKFYFSLYICTKLGWSVVRVLLMMTDDTSWRETGHAIQHRPCMCTHTYKTHTLRQCACPPAAAECRGLIPLSITSPTEVTGISSFRALRTWTHTTIYYTDNWYLFHLLCRLKWWVIHNMAVTEGVLCEPHGGSACVQCVWQH